MSPADHKDIDKLARERNHAIDVAIAIRAGEAPPVLDRRASIPDVFPIEPKPFTAAEVAPSASLVRIELARQLGRRVSDTEVDVYMAKRKANGQA
jgi:hypothetical protein